MRGFTAFHTDLNVKFIFYSITFYFGNKSDDPCCGCMDGHDIQPGSMPLSDRGLGKTLMLEIRDWRLTDQAGLITH